MRNTIGITMVSLAVLVAGGCKGSVSVDAKTGDDKQTMAPTTVAGEPEPPTVVGTDYFGVARGLTLAPGQRQAVCSCVAAAVGPPGDPSFRWQGIPPKVGNDGLVIAISADDIPCETQGNGPSIHAIDRDGDDVIVVLEEHHSQRPKALGAIIPNPGAHGAVYLKNDGHAPYGKPPAGTVVEHEHHHHHWCKIANGTGAASVTPGTQPETLPSSPARSYNE